MKALARKIGGTSDWQRIVREFETTRRPQNAAAVIPAYRAKIARSRAFVERKRLVRCRRSMKSK